MVVRDGVGEFRRLEWAEGQGKGVNGSADGEVVKGNGVVKGIEVKQVD